MKPAISEGVVALLKNEFGIKTQVAHGTSGISFKKGEVSELSIGAAAAVVAIRLFVEKNRKILGKKGCDLFHSPEMAAEVVLAMPACSEDVGDQVTVF